MRPNDRMDQIAPGATMKLMLFGVTVLISLLVLIGIVAVGEPTLMSIMNNTVELIENPASYS